MRSKFFEKSAQKWLILSIKANFEGSLILLACQLIPLYGISNESIPYSYLLHDEHPVKPLLDALFSSSRIILNLDTLKEAGFTFSKPRKFTNLIVAKHPQIPGYIFKLYLDAQRFHKHKPEEHFWKLRINGAALIQHEIETHHLQAYLKVPRKWMYKLPKFPSPPEGYMDKQYILVEEDMDILSEKDNEKFWNSSLVSLEHLQAVFYVITRVGLSDCTKPDNIPFSKDGRIAFIDTQTHGRRVITKRMLPWLSPENQIFWKSLSHEYEVGILKN